jgi:hypothetical protein
MVTLYQTELEIVGLTDRTTLRPKVEKNLEAILKYYNTRQIKAWIKLVEPGSLDTFISQEARRSMMALWLGGQSIFTKIFPRGKVDKLIQGSKSSVLLLR